MTVRITLMAMLLALGIGCSAKAPSIAYGTDTCDFCSQKITNERYGAIAIAGHHAYKFDSIECMVNALASDKLKDAKVSQYLVVDYGSKMLIDASKAHFLASDKLPSPSGGDLTAFSGEKEAQHVQHVTAGELLDWTGVQAHVQAHAKM